MLQKAKLVQTNNHINKEDTERLGKLFFMKVAGQLDEATFTACVEPLLEKLSASVSTIVSPAASNFASRITNNTAVKPIGQQASLKNTTTPKAQSKGTVRSLHKKPNQSLKPFMLPPDTMTRSASLNGTLPLRNSDAVSGFRAQLPN